MRSTTRAERIERIRHRLLELVDDEHSICAVAARCGLLCRGFQHWDDAALQQKFHWLYRPGMSRRTLEARANAYLLGRTAALDQELACDAEQLERDLCRGWDEFSDEDLLRFERELSGHEVEIVDV